MPLELEESEIRASRVAKRKEGEDEEVTGKLVQSCYLLCYMQHAIVHGERAERLITAPLMRTADLDRQKK